MENLISGILISFARHQEVKEGAVFGASRGYSLGNKTLA